MIWAAIDYDRGDVSFLKHCGELLQVWRHTTELILPIVLSVAPIAASIETTLRKSVFFLDPGVYKYN